MSNLPVEVSKLPTEFRGFKRAKAETFSVDGAGDLKIEAACPVAIVQGAQGQIAVGIDADPKDLSKFEARQEGSTVTVRQKGTSRSGSTVTIRESVVGNVSIINGHVFINGREVNSSQDSEEPPRTPLIVIQAPANGNLEAKMMGNSMLVSGVPHNEAYLDLAGQTKAGVAARSLNIDASGQFEVRAIIGGGELEVDLSGQGRVEVQGTFSRVKAELSGMGNLLTEGTVNGDYKAEASGMDSIVHRGQVHGRVRKDASGMAKIVIGS